MLGWREEKTKGKKAASGNKGFTGWATAKSAWLFIKQAELAGATERESSRTSSRKSARGGGAAEGCSVRKGGRCGRGKAGTNFSSWLPQSIFVLLRWACFARWLVQTRARTRTRADARCSEKRQGGGPWSRCWCCCLKDGRCCCWEGRKKKKKWKFIRAWQRKARTVGLLTRTLFSFPVTAI